MFKITKMQQLYICFLLCEEVKLSRSRMSVSIWRRNLHLYSENPKAVNMSFVIYCHHGNHNFQESLWVSQTIFPASTYLQKEFQWELQLYVGLMKSIFSHIGAARNCQSKHISVFPILMMRFGNAYTLIVSKK